MRYTDTDNNGEPYAPSTLDDLVIEIEGDVDWNDHSNTVTTAPVPDKPDTPYKTGDYTLVERIGIPPAITHTVIDEANGNEPITVDAMVVGGTIEYVKLFYTDVGDTVWNVALSGNKAYLAANSAGVVILNVGNPGNIAVEDQYYSPGELQDVFITGGYLYTANGAGGISIFDISP